MTLQGEDYEVHLAESANAALNLADQFEFDLLITDYRLEDIDGLRLTEQVKQNSPRTKVFILTAYGTKELRLQAEQLGVEAFFDKPFDMPALTREIKRHIGTSSPEEPILP